MPVAFVFFNTYSGKDEDALRYVKGLPQVKEAYLTYGVYDGVARVETNTMEELKEVVTWKIKNYESISSTLTTIVVEAEKRE